MPEEGGAMVKSSGCIKSRGDDALDRALRADWSRTSQLIDVRSGQDEGPLIKSKTKT